MHETLYYVKVSQTRVRKETAGGSEFDEKLTINLIINILNENKLFQNKLPFEESLFTWRPYFQFLRAARTSPILMNGGILKSQTLLVEFTIKLHMSNQQHKSEINCPMNVVSYAQIAFKKLIFSG